MEGGTLLAGRIGVQKNGVDVEESGVVGGVDERIVVQDGIKEGNVGDFRVSRKVEREEVLFGCVSGLSGGNTDKVADSTGVLRSERKKARKVGIRLGYGA